MAPNANTSSSTLSEGRTARLVCTPRILVRASLKVRVTSPLRKIPEAYSWRLTVFAGGYATPQILTPPSMMMKVVATVQV